MAYNQVRAERGLTGTCYRISGTRSVAGPYKIGVKDGSFLILPFFHSKTTLTNL